MYLRLNSLIELQGRSKLGVNVILRCGAFWRVKRITKSPDELMLDQPRKDGSVIICDLNDDRDFNIREVHGSWDEQGNMRFGLE